MIVLALNILIVFMQHFSCSLTESCNKVSKLLSMNGNNVIDRKTQTRHLHRYSKYPNLYQNSTTVFPPKMGRPSKLSMTQIRDFITQAKIRLTRNDHQFPSLATFSHLAKSMFGFSPCAATISQILRSHSIKFGSFHNAKGGTRYHDSEIVIKERVVFYYRKSGLWHGNLFPKPPFLSMMNPGSTRNRLALVIGDMNLPLGRVLSHQEKKLMAVV